MNNLAGFPKLISASFTSGYERIQSTSLTIPQLEYLSSKELVTIIPKFKMKTLQLLTGTFGPFMSNVPIEVPLWVAVFLRKRGKCKIQLPQWMTVENLSEMIQAQRNSPKFIYIHFYYQIIAQQLLRCAHEDFKASSLIQTLLSELQSIRHDKFRNSLQSLQPNVVYSLKNLSHMELNTFRPHLLETLNEISTLRRSGQIAKARSIQDPSVIQSVLNGNRNRNPYFISKSQLERAGFDPRYRRNVFRGQGPLGPQPGMSPAHPSRTPGSESVPLPTSLNDSVLEDIFGGQPDSLTPANTSATPSSSIPPVIENTPSNPPLQSQEAAVTDFSDLGFIDTFDFSPTISQSSQSASAQPIESQTPSDSPAPDSTSHTIHRSQGVSIETIPSQPSSVSKSPSLFSNSLPPSGTTDQEASHSDEEDSQPPFGSSQTDTTNI